MTPLPVIPRPAVAIPAWLPPPPPRSQRCSAPGCRETAGHRHHAVARSWQRSVLGIREALDWLEIHGELVCVVVDLCHECHDKLESGWGGCAARLRWAGGWAWYDRLLIAAVPASKSIVWRDAKSGTDWRLRGFCDGEYRLA